MEMTAPWLYDVDVDAYEEQKSNQSDQSDNKMGTLSILAQPPAYQAHVTIVRCHGMNARRAPCTRTAVLSTDRGDQYAKLYCYRHRHQQQQTSNRTNKAQFSWRSRSSVCCNAGASDRRAQLRSTRCKVYCSLSFAVTSLAFVVLGVIKKDALLYLSGTVGLFSSMAWMCIVACEILYQSVPPAIAAQVAFTALYAQVRDTSSSVEEDQQLRCNAQESLVSADIA